MAIDPVSASLLRLEIFQGLKPLQITEIARLAERIVYRPGQVLIEDGQAGDAAVIVVNGEAVRTRAPLSANDIQEPIEPGSMLGEMSMLIETDYTSTVVAKGPVRALRIPRETMMAMMLEDQALTEHLVSKVAGRLNGIASELRRIDDTLAGNSSDTPTEANPRSSSVTPVDHASDMATEGAAQYSGPPIAQMPVASAPSLMAPPVYAVPTLNIVPQRF